MYQFRFCPACAGSALEESPPKRLHCPDCGLVLYLNVATTASLVLRQGDALVMTERGVDPQRGRYDFPGGFVQPNESLEQGLQREIGEELGYMVEGSHYLLSVPNQYLYRGVLYDLCDTYFLLDVAERPALQPADDVAGFRWRQLADIQREEVAFDSVWKVIEYLRDNPSGEKT